MSLFKNKKVKCFLSPVYLQQGVLNFSKLGNLFYWSQLNFSWNFDFNYWTTFVQYFDYSHSFILYKIFLIFCVTKFYKRYFLLFLNTKNELFLIAWIALHKEYCRTVYKDLVHWKKWFQNLLFWIKIKRKLKHATITQFEIIQKII